MSKEGVFMRAKILFALCALCFATMFSFTARADDKSDASAFINNVGKQVLTIISDKSKAKEEKNAALQKMFVDNVDIDWIGKYVVGRAWKTATDAQKQKYMASYQTFIVDHYTTNFAEFTDANFEVTRVVPDDNGGNIVTMRIKRPQAEDVIVDYDVKKSDAGSLKVYDITVEGVSMITTQRSDFTSVINQNSFDYLISQLEARNQKDKQQQ